MRAGKTKAKAKPKAKKPGTAKKPPKKQKHGPSFVASGEAKSAVVDGVTLHVLPIGREVAEAARALSNANVAVSLGAYAASAEAWKAKLTDPVARRRFGYDLLFFAQYRTGAPEGFPFVGGEAEVTPIARGDAFQVIWKQLAAHNVLDPPPRPKQGEKPPPEQTGDRKTFERALRLIIEAALDDKVFIAYRAHWDNADDASADGIFSVDTKTGRAYVITAFELP